MARTPTSPVGLKTLGVRGSATTTSPTMTSPFGTPNTSPQMLANAGRVGSMNVAGGAEGGTGSGTKVRSCCCLFFFKKSSTFTCKKRSNLRTPVQKVP
jgi:hypothetical protein